MLVVQKAEEVAADVPEVVDPTMLSQDMLRKYITFAKQNCHPRLANANVEKISQVSCSPCVTSTQTDGRAALQAYFAVLRFQHGLTDYMVGHPASCFCANI